MAKEIIYDGTAFDSISEFCKAYDLPEGKAYHLFQDGKTPEEVFKACQRNGRHPVVVAGVKYSSLRKFCEENGAPYSTVYNRYKQNLPLEGFVKKNKGCDMPSQGKAAGSYKVYVKLLKSGAQVEEALRAVKQRPTRRSRKIMYEGVMYNSRSDLCRKLELNLHVFSRCLNDGMTVTEAVQTSRVSSYNKALKVNGVYYRSYREFCRLNEMNLSTLQWKLANGKIRNELDD